MHDITRTTSATYMFLDYCSEGDLKSFISNFNKQKESQQGRQPNILPESEARYIVREIVQGLTYLEENNIIHRDIKLDNILANRKQGAPGTQICDYEFKLGDMGLAKQVESKTAMNSTFAGTPLAMAPELINGKQYSFKADVWSLGTLLFQLLTGTHPFTGRNMEELKSNIKKGAYKIPRDIELSVECIDFLNSCLRFDTIKRKDWLELRNHMFLSQQRLFRENTRESFELNVRQSMNLHQVYQNKLLQQIEKKLEEHKNSKRRVSMLR